MKKTILAVFLIIFAASLGHTQQVTEKSNTIICTQPDSVGLREKVLKILADKDYTISSGKTAALITTAPRTLKNGTRIYLCVTTKGADIILTGKLPVAGQSTMSISYQGKKGTAIMNGWEEMEKMAKAFGGKMSYATK